MNKKHNRILTALFAMIIASGTAVNMAQAGESNEKEAKELKLFNQDKIPLTEAIQTAEKKVGGKAVEAEMDDESNTVQFEIEVVKDGKVQNVLVDGKTGEIVKVSLDDEVDEGSENK